MESSSIITLLLVCASATLGYARKPPNAALVEEYFKSGILRHSRFSDNLLEDASLDVPNLIKKYGYPSEVHEVVTEDGYILEMHRIPHGRDRNNQQDPTKPVVFVMHGLLASSADWVLMGPGTALGYILAEAGYDVWLGNARGNFYSRRHVTLDPDNRRNLEFWKFSWEEFGRFDLPAMLDYALNVTGKSRLHFIGHSQGTTAFWVMCSLRPEYNSKIITMQAYGPVAYGQYSEVPLMTTIAPFANSIVAVAGILGVGGLFTQNYGFSESGVCTDGSKLQPICTSFLFALAGYSGEQHNATMFPVKLAHTPAGCSLRQLAHFGQLTGKDYFRRYDHGSLENFRRYGSFTPPLIELNKVTAPVFLHHAEPDPFTNFKDVQRLQRELGRPMALYIVPSPFSHIDFMWGQYAKDALFDKTIDIMNVFGAN